MEDEALVRRFEAATLGEGEFPHAAHVRVAWYYLSRHPFPHALDRFSAALRRFAAAKGVPGLYHETITVAYLLLIAERLDAARGLSWTVFAARNPDLLAKDPPILSRYYSDALLKSERARRVFVMPDRVSAD